jgi:hypothetical protein
MPDSFAHRNRVSARASLTDDMGRRAYRARQHRVSCRFKCVIKSARTIDTMSS